jgi:hypothetical protein
VAAADQVRAAVLDAFVVNGESTHKDCHLKEEVNNDTKASYKTEVLQGGHISDKTNEKGK